MEKIKLNKDEKRLLRNISQQCADWPDNMGSQRLADCADYLEQMGLIRVAWGSGYEVIAAEVTEHGARYLLNNPHLKNPIDWKWIVMAVIAAASVVTTILVACSRM